MQRFFVTEPETHARIAVHLASLAEYEADGGIYADTGNGGEDMADQRDTFLCAAAIPDPPHGMPENDVLTQLAGVPAGTYWLDSATGWFLLREWPAEAPLNARMLEA